MKLAGRSILIAVCLAVLVALAPSTSAQPDPAARVAAVKQWLAESKAHMKGYQWIETTTVAVKGDVKSTKVNSCFYDVTGTLQKVQMSASAPPPKKPGIRGAIQKDMMEELSDYMSKAVALVKLWFEKRFRKHCRGEAYFYRYADDFLACFQYQEDAERFLIEMKERLEGFHLEVEPSKTKLLAFGRFAEKNAKQQGMKPETFDFLGFTHYCDKTRYGVFKVKRRTAKKKFRAKLKDFGAWLKAKRSVLKKGELLKRAKAKLVGHLNYYAITDNGRMCDSYRRQVTNLLYHWMNRQSQRRSYTWERFASALAWIGWPSIHIVHNLDPFRRTVGPKSR